MAGGAGGDTYIVDSSFDAITGIGRGLDLVLAGASYGLSANVENLVLQGLQISTGPATRWSTP